MSSALKLETEVQSVVVEFGQPLPQGVDNHRCILVCDQNETVSVIDYLVSSGIKHAVNKAHLNFEHELTVAKRMVCDPDVFFKNPGELILGAQGLQGYERVLAESREKSRHLADMRAYLEKIPRSKTILDPIVIVADELITNAFYNAPVDGKKNKKFNDLDRNINIGLKENERPRFIVNHTDSWVMVGVSDPFGSLNPTELLAHILKGLKEGITSVMSLEESGGAHIGSLMVLDLSIGLYIGVDRHHRTQVCATLPLGKSHRVISGHPKSIHVLFRDGKI